MEQEKKLIKKTVIYAIGNIGSKILSYIMVLVYSHYISAQELGYYDLIITTFSMIEPLIMFQLTDGVYRFLVDGDENIRSIVLTTSFKFICLSTFISEVILCVVCVVYKLEYSVWIMAYLCSSILFIYFHDAIRGLGQTKFYAAIGIINSIILLAVEFLGIIVFKLGVLALLIANVISMVLCCAIMIVYQPEFRDIVKIKFNKRVICKLMEYSVPLIPNTICWWIVNSSDRYIIRWFLGPSFNGIYSISNKFPTVLTTITGIFYLAWQESAIKEYNSSNRDSFFSSVFKKYYILLFSLCICAIPMTHIVIEMFIGIEYKTAWLYSGFLYLGAVFSALCSFLGLGYQISKETNRSISTTVIAAAVNILINIMLIRYIGLYAASFSTFIAYLFLFIIRIKHTKKYFALKIEWVNFVGLFVCALIVLVSIIIIKDIFFSSVILVFSVIFMLILNRQIICLLIKKHMNSNSCL